MQELTAEHSAKFTQGVKFWKIFLKILEFEVNYPKISSRHLLELSARISTNISSRIDFENYLMIFSGVVSRTRIVILPKISPWILSRDPTGTSSKIPLETISKILLQKYFSRIHYFSNNSNKNDSRASCWEFLEILPRIHQEDFSNIPLVIFQEFYYFF